MQKRLLTDTFVRGLGAAPPGKRLEYWDTKVPGFGVRVTDQGAKSYVLYARFPPQRVPARRALGNAAKMGLAAARKKAGRWLDLVEQGRDPREVERLAQLQAVRAAHTTFATIAEAWLEEAVRGRQRKAREVEADVRREFIPLWGKRPVTEITTLDVRNAIRGVRARAPAQARNLLGYARRLFTWAVGQHAYGLDISPVERLRPKELLGRKAVRQRVLTDTEMWSLWRATERLDYPYGPLFRMLALTGQRKSEVAEARWREFDLVKRLWTIPPGRMKGDAAHEVPLADDVISILTELPQFQQGDHLFSTTYGSKPVNGFSKAKDRLDRRMLRCWRALGRIRGEDRRKAIIEPWVIHDIRRSVRTGLSGLPIPNNVCELVIAHAQPGMHKVYDQHAYLDEKRRALELWAAKLRSIVTPPPANVVQLRRQGS